MSRKEIRLFRESSESNATRDAAEKRVLTLLGNTHPDEAERFRKDGKMVLAIALNAGASKDDLLLMGFDSKWFEFNAHREAAQERVLPLLEARHPEEAEIFRTEGKLMLAAALQAGATKDDLLAMEFEPNDVSHAQRKPVLSCVGCERLLHDSILPGADNFKQKNICRDCLAKVQPMSNLYWP